MIRNYTRKTNRGIIVPKAHIVEAIQLVIVEKKGLSCHINSTAFSQLLQVEKRQRVERINDSILYCWLQKQNSMHFNFYQNITVLLIWVMWHW
jgi:hypothetical protein